MVKIDPQIKISELINLYPEVAEYLVVEYQFHCVNCFIADFDTLEEGAAIHGIAGEDFEEMMRQIEKIVEEHYPQEEIGSRGSEIGNI